MTVILGEKSLLVYFETESYCVPGCPGALDQAGAYLTCQMLGSVRTTVRAQMCPGKVTRYMRLGGSFL